MSQNFYILIGSSLVLAASCYAIYRYTQDDRKSSPTPQIPSRMSEHSTIRAKTIT